MATLVYSDVDGTDRSFALGAEPILVGRSPECAIRSEDPRVSRTHARFFLEHGALWVEDLGSSNGIYVGPQKVQRAPVPTGEIVLIGSLMIRLLPQSGTLPPPVGLHGTLAQWLEMERKARSAVEDERDAFVNRVGQLFEEIKSFRDAQAAHEAEATELRGQLELLQRESAAELEIAKLEIAKAREAKMIAETTAGMQTAERLAESDIVISGLQHEVASLRQANAAKDDSRELAEQIAAATQRAEKAEKELATAQIRAQGAERNLSAANTAAAKAETHASELEHKLSELGVSRGQLEADLAAAREQAKALEARTSGMTPSAKLDAAEARATKLATELAEVSQIRIELRDRVNELETSVSDARAAKSASVEAEKRVQATLAEAQTKARVELAAANAKIGELEARLKETGTVESEIAAARKARDEAQALVAAAEKRAAEALARADDQDKRASAADTMAKAMAKDVAEALRRAVEADAKARAVSRELAGAHQKAADAEQKALAVTEAEDRAKAAEAKAAETAAAVGAQLAELETRLTTASTALLTELRDKLAATQRELAAERGSAMALVTAKTQIERELAELKAASASMGEAAEKLAAAEVQIEQLEERVQDLESGIAVEQTASKSSVDEHRAKVQKLEEQLGEAKAAAKTALKTAASLEKRVDANETELANAKQARAALEAELAAAKQIAAELEVVRGAASDAERRALAAEAQIESLEARAEAADLAIGRAAALQRQLDESLQKLSWLERDQAGRSGIDEKIAQLEAQLDDAENRARTSEAHAREYADRIREGVKRASDLEVEFEAAQTAHRDALAQAQIQISDAVAAVEELEAQTNEAQGAVRELEAKLRASEQRSTEVDTRARDIEQRAKDAAERIVDAERRARDGQNQVAELKQMLAAAEAQVAESRASGSSNNAGLERQLAAAQQRIAELEREVDSADNVRQFAANTEREIAQLERELRETKAKAAQVLLERDSLEAQLRDLREDDETNARGIPESPAVDLTRYTELVSRSAELEQRNLKLEKEQIVMRRLLAEAEARVEAQQRAHEDEPTNTGNAMPIEFAEHLNVLEESIDSLKANMRAASDETAMMDQNDSVAAVSQAVSQAAEHVERARDALKILTAMVAKH